MAAILAAPNFVAQYLDWEKINKPNFPPTPAANVVANYNASRLTPYIVPAAGLPPLPNGPSPILEIIKPVPIPPVSTAGPATFNPTADFPTVPANWQGVKLLGDGNYGEVSLWEWHDTANPPLPIPQITKIAVKVSPNPTIFLRNEADTMSLLNTANSQHIVRLLVDPATLMTQAGMTAEALGDAAWLMPPPLERVRRLIMEYCEQGSLDKLVVMRKERNIRFEELTLWRIFECLIDGCAVLEHEAEFTIDGAGIAQIPLTSPVFAVLPLVSGATFVHFDMKPANIMTSGREPGGHPDTPVCKLGDFGLTMRLQRNPLPPFDMWGINQAFRRRGSPKYLAPEQFSDRWNHSDYKTGNICGRYGSHTNVWGIGQIMYDLACYDQVPAQAHLPWFPPTIHTLPPQGRIFGVELPPLSPPFSVLLKDTIQECLYEVPARRPTLLVLKRRARAAINAALIAAVGFPELGPEGWQDLNCVEPLMPAQAAAIRIVKLRCTRTEFPGRNQCKRTVQVRSRQGLVRCFQHWDLREHPHGQRRM
ncbi:hypothetical protein VTL71DRAFT_9851 [Oculimacula yallundae]|uniref:Protein kinase domain-containing protein n=1 Tax=Oculimacula yallundae TaxID=86028 RepID=A0ABR4BQQ4_9HELO